MRLVLLPPLLLLAGSTVPTAWAQCPLQKVVQGPTTGFDVFGGDVSTFGGEALFSATNFSSSVPGAAFLFERQTLGWVEAEMLTSSGPAQEKFGSTVLLREDLAVVGAPGASGTSSAAYVFERPDPATAFGAPQRLEADVPASGDSFGFALAYDDGVLAVGAPGLFGAVHLFERDAAGWVHVQKLLQSTPDGARYGYSVAISGTRLIVGAPGDASAAGFNPGGVYFYERGPGGWVETQKFMQGSFDMNTHFPGTAVAMDGDVAVSGAPHPEVETSGVIPGGNGFATVYEHDGASWSPKKTLVASDAGYDEQFGIAVDAVAGRIAVGAVRDLPSGKAYLFERGAAGWTETARLEPSDPTPFQGYGGSVALGPDTLWIGASGDPASGAAYAVALMLCADVDQVSLAAGGVQALELWGGLANGGLVHWTLGSASGVAPGFAVGALAVPLNPDAYLLYTLQHPAAPPLAGGLGLLDGAGHSSAAVVVPAGTSGALAGVVLTHAFGVLDPVAATVAAVSNPRSLQLAP